MLHLNLLRTCIDFGVSVDSVDGEAENRGTSAAEHSQRQHTLSLAPMGFALGVVHSLGLVSYFGTGSFRLGAIGFGAPLLLLSANDSPLLFRLISPLLFLSFAHFSAKGFAQH